MSQDLFSKLETDYGLPSGILDAVWETESARGKRMKSPKGAEGHFQFMPATAKEMGVADPYDLNSSAQGAAKYLSTLMKQFGGNVELALAAYNAGPGNVQKYNGIPPFPETQGYIQKVKATMQNVVPDFDFSGVPDFSFGEKKKPEQPKVDWQTELDKEAGLWLPLAGSFLGGLAGGAAGTPLGPAGNLAGGTAGGIAGGAVGTWANIKDHPAPIEEKLAYLAKQGLFDLAVTGGMVGIGKGIGALAKMMAKTPAEVKLAEEWLRKNGVNINPEVGMGKKAGLNVYKDAAERMGVALDDAVTRVRVTLNNTRNVDDLGREFKNARTLFNEFRKDQGDQLFAPFRRGGAYHGGIADMTPVADEAKTLLRDIGDGWKKAFGDTKPQTIQILEEAASMAGKGNDVGELIAKRRQLQSAMETDNLLGSVDDFRKKKLFEVIDQQLEEALKKSGGDPAVAAYRKANFNYRQMASVLESELFDAILKRDPVFAAKNLGKMATPSNVREFNRVMDNLVRTRSITRVARDELLDTARADWLTNNFRTLGDMARLHPTHGDFDKTQREIFNSLFANSSSKTDLDAIARNAKVLDDMIAKLPKRGDHMPPGTISVAAAAGSTAAGSPGALGVMAGVLSMTHVPQMWAHAVTTGDKGLINAIKFVSTWAGRNAASNVGQGALRGGLQGGVPPAVAEALAYIDSKRREAGIKD